MEIKRAKKAKMFLQRCLNEYTYGAKILRSAGFVYIAAGVGYDFYAAWQKWHKKAK